MQESLVFKRKNISDWACQEVNNRYEYLAKVGAGTYGYLSSLLFHHFFHRKIRSNSVLIHFFSEVHKARSRSNPSQLVALKKIKDERETEGVSFIFSFKIILDLNFLNILDFSSFSCIYSLFHIGNVSNLAIVPNYCFKRDQYLAAV